jgi:hypothetical protein
MKSRLHTFAEATPDASNPQKSHPEPILKSKLLFFSSLLGYRDTALYAGRRPVGKCEVRTQGLCCQRSVFLSFVAYFERKNTTMDLTIDLSEQIAAALEAQARAAHMPLESYLSKIVVRALHSQDPGGGIPEQSAGQPLTPKKSAYGLLAKYGPGPMEKEIDDNRREMFSGFGELAP